MKHFIFVIIITLSFSAFAAHFNEPSKIKTPAERKVFLAGFSIGEKAKSISELNKLKGSKFEKFILLTKKFSNEERLREMKFRLMKLSPKQRQLLVKFKGKDCKAVRSEFGDFTEESSILCENLDTVNDSESIKKNICLANYQITSRFGKTYFNSIEGKREHHKAEIYKKYSISSVPSRVRALDYGTLLADKVTLEVATPEPLHCDEQEESFLKKLASFITDSDPDEISSCIKSI